MYGFNGCKNNYCNAVLKEIKIKNERKVDWNIVLLRVQLWKKHKKIFLKHLN